MVATLPPSTRLFVFGLGYVGLHTACTARDLGAHVMGSCRSPEKAQALASLLDGTHAFDLDDAYAGLDAAGLEALASATHVLATVCCSHSFHASFTRLTSNVLTASTPE